MLAILVIEAFEKGEVDDTAVVPPMQENSVFRWLGGTAFAATFKFVSPT